MLMATSNQAYVFLSALYMGIIIGVVYDVYRVIRILSNPSKLVIGIMDILFWITAAMLSIVGFFYVSSGEIRLYGLIGLALGWMLYLLTFSRYIIKSLVRLFKGILWVCRKLIELLVYPFQAMIDILQFPGRLWIRCSIRCKEKFSKKNIHKKEDS